MKRQLMTLLLALGLVNPALAQAAGVNIAGAEFNGSAMPGIKDHAFWGGGAWFGGVEKYHFSLNPLNDHILKVYVSGQEVTWNATLTIVSDTAGVQWVRRDKGTFSYVRPGTTTFRVEYQGAITERTITLP